MAKTLEPIEIGDIPELVRLAEEVQATGASRPLRRNGKDVAVLEPAGPAKLDASAIAAWEKTLGAWSDVDVDETIERIYRAREEGSRPASRP